VNLLLVAVGVAALYGGGDLLVRHASRLARLLGVAPMVVGLTVVAFGTSAPELAATLVAAFRGEPELALANVVGSNIANVGLILGLTALAYPLVAGSTFLRREVAWMLAVTLVSLPLLFDGVLTRPEGLLLWAGLALFLVVALRSGTLPAAAEEIAADAPAGAGAAEARGIARSVAMLVVGIALLAVGAQALVQGATALAVAWGIPSRVIGLTLVAVGTSLPELASSLVAALRKETDIILGNVIGSNLFNLLAVLGTAAVVQPIVVAPEGLRLDLWIMLGFSLALVPLLLWGRDRLGRRGGGILLVAYVVYAGWLFA
jgi:cation:H+ antiporter